MIKTVFTFPRNALSQLAEDLSPLLHAGCSYFYCKPLQRIRNLKARAEEKTSGWIRCQQDIKPGQARPVQLRKLIGQMWSSVSVRFPYWVGKGHYIIRDETQKAPFSCRMTSFCSVIVALSEVHLPFQKEHRLKGKINALEHRAFKSQKPSTSGTQRNFSGGVIS